VLSLLLLLSTALAGTPADAAYDEALAAQKAGRLDTALELYRRCLELDPAHVACRWEEGWVHWSLGRYDASVRDWEEVRRLDPAHPDLDAWLGKAKALAASTPSGAALASAPATVTPKDRPARTLRLRAVGDVMLGSDFPTPKLAPDDGAHLLEPVADWLKDADVTFANLEGPLCDAGTTDKCRPDSSACYAFRSPTRYAPYLTAAGVDVVSTANNHAGDFGELCRRQTEAALDAQGIGWSGPPGTVATVERGGLRIAVVAFHTSSSCNWLNDHEAAATLVKKASNGHDLVVVSFHGGAEGASRTHVPDEPEQFYGEDRGHLRAFARAVIAAGADVVIGHGPHVLRGLEVVDGHLVAYSLGNFATYGRFNLSGVTGLGAVLEVTLDPATGKLVEGRILPTRQLGEGGPVPDPEGRAIAAIVQLSAEDFPDTAPIVARDGRFVPR
jgi:hypothetical protein